jgi:hypothetical protein
MRQAVRLPTYYLLPTTYYLLPTTYYLLPTTYLPTAYLPTHPLRASVRLKRQKQDRQARQADRRTGGQVA